MVATPGDILSWCLSCWVWPFTCRPSVRYCWYILFLMFALPHLQLLCSILIEEYPFCLWRTTCVDITILVAACSARDDPSTVCMLLLSPDCWANVPLLMIPVSCTRYFAATPTCWYSVVIWLFRYVLLYRHVPLTVRLPFYRLRRLCCW